MPINLHDELAHEVSLRKEFSARADKLAAEVARLQSAASLYAEGSAKLTEDNEKLRAALRDIALGPGEYILSQDDMQGRACDALGFVRVDAMEGAQDVG